MRLVIVGPGALGTMLAVRLAPWLQKGGGTLSLLDHDPLRATALNQSGLSLYREETGPLSVSIPVSADPLKLAPCDLILLCVKSTHIDKALQQAAPLTTKETIVIGLQNGMAHLEALRQTPGIGAAGTTAAGASLKAPGKVIFGGEGLTRFGFLAPERPPGPGLKPLVQLFTRAGLAAEEVENIELCLWEKLFINVAVNALTALHDRENGWLLKQKKIRATMRAAIAEAEAVADRKGIPIAFDPWKATLEVCARTEKNISSMLQDVRHRRPTEIEAINGYIVKAGRELGIPTPVNSELVRRIRELEQSWTTTTKRKER